MVDTITESPEIQSDEETKPQNPEELELQSPEETKPGNNEKPKKPDDEELELRSDEKLKKPGDEKAKKPSDKKAKKPSDKKIKTAVHLSQAAVNKLGAACVIEMKNQSQLIEHLITQQLSTYSVQAHDPGRRIKFAVSSDR